MWTATEHGTGCICHRLVSTNCVQHCWPLVRKSRPFDWRPYAPTARPSSKSGRHACKRRHNVVKAEATGAVEPGLKRERLVIPVGDEEITLETGEIGRQANGAVTLTAGTTILYTTACCSNSKTTDGFLPLSVNYGERFSAAGRTSGSWLKRDGRPKDGEILVSRLIDRPLRPMFASGWTCDTQVLSWVLSYDSVHLPEPLAITAAGAALAVSDIPLRKAVAGARVGLLPGRGLVLNPSAADMANSTLDLLVAGTADALLMIEGFCDFLSDEQMLQEAWLRSCRGISTAQFASKASRHIGEAVRMGMEAVAGICRAVDGWAARVGKPKRSVAVAATAHLDAAVEALAGAELKAAYCIAGKQERGAAVHALQERCLAQLALLDAGRPLRGVGDEDAESEAEEAGEVQPGTPLPPPTAILAAFKSPSAALRAVQSANCAGLGAFVENMWRAQRVEAGVMRGMAVDEGRRADGRRASEVRPIAARAGLLPATHGAALFTRGETQALAVATLGSDMAAQRVDTMVGGAEEGTRRFYLQYFFPPSSVGETGRVGAASRRELGHANLAERALAPAIPDEADFPYTIRVESTITESNGSSSMASVCGGYLALLDAGVPLRGAVAGVAMGLILEPNGRFCVLTDILGAEDALGDMDFKVAGDAHNITAFQMDLKVEGITLEVLAAALTAAGEARQHILERMAACNPAPRRTLAPSAPRILRLRIPVDTMGQVIGPGGRTIRSLEESSGVQRLQFVDPSGVLEIVAPSDETAAAARAAVLRLIEAPEAGKIYRGCSVTSVERFGVFVEFLPGKEGLVHVSELDRRRSGDLAAWSPGDIMDVKLLEIGDAGKFRMSRKAVLLEEGGSEDDKDTDDKDGAAPHGQPTIEAGDVFRNVPVRRAEHFGVFVDLAPGVTGLVHISELDVRRTPTTAAFPEGMLLDVKVLEVSGGGRFRLSRRAVLLEDADSSTGNGSAGSAAAPQPATS